MPVYSMHNGKRDKQGHAKLKNQSWNRDSERNTRLRYVLLPYKVHHTNQEQVSPIPGNQYSGEGMQAGIGRDVTVPRRAWCWVTRMGLVELPNE